jgi:YfiH family protein
MLRAAGFRHAFFTRAGGVSSGPYRSLNFSVAVGDAEENVQQNLERAGSVLGVAASRIFYLSQVHGRDVHVLSGEERRQEVLECRGDALVSGALDLACGVRSADCVPILIADQRSGRVAAVHAGWRGIVADVVGAAVATLRAGAPEPAELVAAIGPHISSRAFEVSADVAAEIAAACGEDSVADYTRGPRPYVDLRRAARLELRRAGVLDRAIDDVEGCTLGDSARFFSFRRDGKTSGRHLSAIAARSS